MYRYDISPILKMYFQPGRQLAEYMRDEMSAEQTVYKTFEFTQNVPNHNPPSSVSGKIWLCFKNRLHSSKSPETIKFCANACFTFILSSRQFK